MRQEVQPVYQAGRDVVWCTAADSDQIVLFHPEPGTYHGLNPVGTIIWNQLASGATVADIVNRVSERYSGDPLRIEREVDQFVQELLRVGLVQVTSLR
jgi:hypothetical protein